MSYHLLEYQWLCDSGKIWYMLDRAVDEILKVYQKKLQECLLAKSTVRRTTSFNCFHW